MLSCYFIFFFKLILVFSLVISKNSEKYQKIPQTQLEDIAKNRNKLKLNVVLEPGIKLPNNDFFLNKTCKHLLIEYKRVFF